MAFLFKQVKKSRKVIKTQSSQEVLDKLQGFLDASLEEPVTILARFWEDQQNAVTYQEIRQALLDGTLTTDYIDLWQQDYSKLVTDKLAPLWENAMKAGASGIKDMLNVSQIELNSWGINNWVTSHGGEFITVITGEQKAAARFFIEQSIQGKYTVDELSRVIRPCVGLNEQQAKANLNYYNHVKESLKKDHPRMKARSIEAKAHEAAVKYAEKQHRSRAFMIAQTELAFAYNKGTDDGIRQAQSQNLLGNMEKRWSTSGDANVCMVCAALDGMQISMDGEFDFPGRVLYDGGKQIPPAHPRCACAVQYIEVAPHDMTVPKAGTSEGMQEFSDDDIIKMSGDAHEIVNQYTGNESKWSGRTIIRDPDDEITAGKEWNCDISVRQETSMHILVHEHLHAHSVSYHSPKEYIEHMLMEETAVELLAEEISVSNGFTVVESAYDDYVDRIKKLNRIIKITDSDSDFAKRLFAKPMTERLKWIEEEVYSYAKDKTAIEYMELTELLSVFRS